MTPLCTSGYQGQDVAAWVVRMRSHGVELIVDIRELPLSRKKGFSKSQLSALLQQQGIDYLHLKDLGNPRPLRKALKDGLSFDDFSAQFEEYLAGHEEALVGLLDLATSAKTCILCFEEDPSECHRSIVAKRLSERYPDTIDVVHL